MKFDIARKIVKFKNGQFGIRRWTLFGYRYLGMNLNDFWWGAIPEHVAFHATGTEEQVRSRLEIYLRPKAPPIEGPGIDKGTPV